MHVTIKDVVQNADHAKETGLPVGTHILTSVIEGDGAVALASAEATFKSKIISVTRTISGGIQVQSAVTVVEPLPAEAPKPLTPQDEAVAYFVGKGFAPDAAVAQVSKFGTERVLALRDQEESDAKAAEDAKLSEELKAAVAPKGTVQ